MPLGHVNFKRKKQARAQNIERELRRGTHKQSVVDHEVNLGHDNEGQQHPSVELRRRPVNSRSSKLTTSTNDIYCNLTAKMRFFFT